MGPCKGMRRWAAAMLVLFALPFSPLAAADERQELEALRATTLKLIQLLVQEGVLTQEKANALIKEAGAAAPPPSAQAKPAVRVPYMPQAVKDDITNQLREEVIATAKAERWADPGRLPEWADRLALDGDLRFRWQHDFLDKNNAPPAFFQALGQNINNTTEDRNRLRLRARLNVKAKVNDEVEAAIGLATGTQGSTGNPASTNNTLGDSFNRQVAGFDLAYVAWRPFGGMIDWGHRDALTLTGGRFRNPFLASDLVWAPDLNFDGVIAALRPSFGELWRPFMVLGAFPLKENEPDPTQPTRKNKWLYGYQGGLEWGYPSGLVLRGAAAYYDYRNIAGIPNTDPLNPNANDWSAPQFRQHGNTLFPINLAGNPALFGLASQFRIVNLVGEAGFRYDEFRRLTLTADWAKNVGFDSSEIDNRTGGVLAGLQARTNALQYRAQFGHVLIERRWDWFAYGAYKRVERDAVLDAFVEGDFNLGGTNAKGWIVGGGLGVGRNAWLGLKYTTANQIDGPPLAIDTFMLDFNARF